MNQSELFDRVKRLLEHPLLSSGWSASRAEDSHSVLLCGPDHQLLVLDVESTGRPGCPEHIRVRGRFGDLAVPAGIRCPTINLAIAQTDRQWADRICHKLLGTGSRGKNYTATVAGLTVLNSRAASATVREAEQRAVDTGRGSWFDSSAEQDAALVREPGELIASIPAMIGFTPQRSLIALVLRAAPDRSGSVLVDAVLRFDLARDERTPLRAETVAGHVELASAHADAARVLAVVVDDRATVPKSCDDAADARCRTDGFDFLIAVLGRRLAARGITLAAAWAVRAIEDEQDWWYLLGSPQRGVLPDPDATTLAKVRARDGQPIRGSRAELTALVAEDAELQAAVAALLDGALADARMRQAAAVRRGDPAAYSRRALEYVLWQIASVESGQQLMAPEFAEIAVALRDRSVRDAMFAVAVGEHARAAEALWSELARVLSGPDRAQSAALLAYSTYVRGDGPLAGIALEAALSTDPDHALALLLHTCLSLGMRPEKLQRLARSGVQSADDLGIELASFPA